MAAIGLILWSFAADILGRVGDGARGLERLVGDPPTGPIVDVAAALGTLFTPHI